MSDYDVEIVSADSGEPVEAPTDAPEVVEEPQVETVEPTNEEETTEEAPQVEDVPEDDGLVELPDGRRLTPEEVKGEYLKIQSDYTRKSQKLATYEKGNITKNNQAPEEKEEWVPQTYDEIIERAVQEVKQRENQEKQQEIEYRKQLEDSVVSQLEEIKKDNPNLNEGKLFEHAMKYNFRDLKVAHSNMRDMQTNVEKTAKQTAENLKKRSSDPVSGDPQGGYTPDGDVYDPGVRNIDAVDFLKSLK